MGLNNAGKNARRLARYLLLFEIFINAIQFGLIFVAIGHDANSSLECFGGASGNIGVGGTCAGVCSSPPAGNPNVCHVYTWKNFPNVNTNVPTTGMFSNDTSYYLPFNQTSVVSFSMCVYLSTFFGDGNMTLFLQYMSVANNGWINVDNGASHTGGSISVFGVSGPITICSTTLGYLPGAGLATDCSGQGVGYCLFRIGGSTPQTPSSITGTSVTITELLIQFYFTSFSAKNSITCSATSISTTQFTNTCGRILTGTTDSLTVRWEANNLGVTFQSGTVTCSFLSTGGTCINIVTFSPAFAVAPSVLESQSKVIGTGTISGGNSAPLAFLT